MSFRYFSQLVSILSYAAEMQAKKSILFFIKYQVLPIKFSSTALCLYFLVWLAI